MSKNTVIESVFLTADDALQGLWGLHAYVNAAVDTAAREQMKNRLPPKYFQMTHEWVRSYDPEDLLKEMDLVFESIQCRNSLVLLVSVFEGTVRRFNEELHRLSLVKKEGDYKPLLRWVFDLLRNTGSGSAAMQSRLPETCGDLDNARRLRNCFAHNNGRYNQRYLDDAIQDNWVLIRHLGGNVAQTVAAREKILIFNGQLERLLRSHIEVLHMAYNTVQRTFFGETQDYNYATEDKRIEWHRILSGQTFVGM